MDKRNNIKVGFCTTTINIPFFLEKFAINFLKNKHKNIIFYVIGDYKTPKKAEKFVKELNKKYPYEFRYYDIYKIKQIFRYENKLKRLIKFYSGIMKFIGVYLSYKEDCKLCLQIDDDNFILEKDYLGEAKKILHKNKITLLKSTNGWSNIYHYIKERNNLDIYPRAYPWSKRFQKNNDIKIKKIIKPVFFNGTVLGDPDIDAIARLNNDIYVTGFRNKNMNYFGLYPGTWTSFNNQNSGLIKELVPAYFTPYSTGRNADIWASYMICKIIEIHKNTVSFGRPVVKQIRNPHNLWQDLKDELKNDILTDKFTQMLKRLKIKKRQTYLLTCEEICKKALEYLRVEMSDLNKSDKDYIRNFFKEYLLWIKIFKN